MKTCINCGAPATCEHHIVPLTLGGRDIPSNRAPLCDLCHGLIHGVEFETGGMSHSELIKAGQQRKREAEANGKQYKSRRGISKNPIGRPATTKKDIPKSFVRIYKKGQYKTVTELARITCLSRTTVTKYIELLK